MIRKHKQQDIEQSVYRFQSVILTDPELKLKLLDDSSTYGGKLINWSDINLILEIPVVTATLTVYKKYTLNFVTTHSLFLANVIVINKIPKTSTMFYLMKLTSPIRQKRQRNYLRVNAELPMTFIVVPEKFSTRDALPPPVKAYTVDISAGGLKFKHNELLLGTPKVYISFALHGTTFSLTGQLLESYEISDTPPYTYRVAFKEMIPETQAKLEKMLMSFQKHMPNKDL
ncbi:MAG: hypothetical protein ATN33_05235 [Epulopiscium sp. Nele67-Bin001]|nr:MAG: hypothetical protein ATN33_05235 [Epulopiscium sp. Nele67-Bin001]